MLRLRCCAICHPQRRQPSLEDPARSCPQPPRTSTGAAGRRPARASPGDHSAPVGAQRGRHLLDRFRSYAPPPPIRSHTRCSSDEGFVGGSCRHVAAAETRSPQSIPSARTHVVGSASHANDLAWLCEPVAGGISAPVSDAALFARVRWSADCMVCVLACGR
jgi:hypothetical protein